MLTLAQAEAASAKASEDVEGAAAKQKAAAEARQRLGAERKTLEQAQAALDSTLLEVRRHCFRIAWRAT